MRAYNIAISITLIIFLTSIIANSGSADEPSEPLSGVSVFAVTATEANSGETSRLSLIIENYSDNAIILIGVESDYSGSGAIMIKQNDSSIIEASELVVLPGKLIFLKTSKTWVELRNLTRPLKSGDYVDFKLKFRTGDVPGTAHVHQLQQ